MSNGSRKSLDEQREEVRRLLEYQAWKRQPSKELLAKQARLLRHLQSNVSPDELTGSSPLAKKPGK